MFELEEDVSMDLTPLIDVIFMLLVFFIMTTTFSKPVLDIVLPKAEQAESASTKQVEMLLAVKADGSIFYEEKKVSVQQLPQLLESNPDALLNLHMDEKAPFEAFVLLVDLTKKTRGGRFVISTQQADLH